MEGRVYRNYSEGHMDITKGKVEAGEGGRFGCSRVERWGETAENCN